ncbi:hypothetical protein SASPL_118148 [Salvia splendens]|uniref:Uncharacterized protein n=1 Tax=Salvia splendens TaxID=180675 RepID=A0A8X8Y1U8_SALSN|nr:hypothetical protein SASPL_118148 [Salvia splendens]
MISLYFYYHYISLSVPISGRHRNASEALRRRNVELERDLRSSLEGEERVEEELRMTWQHVRLVEEWFCSELDELEAEVVDHAMESRAQITLLMEKLSASNKLLQSLSLNNLSLNNEKFATMIAEAGFQKVEYENLVGGVVAIHLGLKFCDLGIFCLCMVLITPVLAV